MTYFMLLSSTSYKGIFCSCTCSPSFLPAWSFFFKAEKTGCSRKLNHSLQRIFIGFLFLVKRHWLIVVIDVYTNIWLYIYCFFQYDFFFKLNVNLFCNMSSLHSLNKSFWHKNNCLASKLSIVFISKFTFSCSRKWHCLVLF